MSHLFSMLNGIGSLIFDFITGIFAYIPQMMYFIYTCGASVIDFLQYVMRKLAGLDVYYINGVEQSGDILLSFFKGILGIEGSTNSTYSTLSTVFWSMVIFGVVLIFMTTIIKMISSHYNYDPEESKPSTIIKGSLKALFTIALIPIVTIFGVEISNTLLGVLDQISSGGTSVTIEAVYENSAIEYSQFFRSGEDSWGKKTYTSYDFFGSTAFTNQTTISGVMFQVAANKANRVRSGSYTPSPNGSSDGWSSFGIFTSTNDNDEARREEVSYMIDYAFANCLTTHNPQTAKVLQKEAFVLVPTYLYLQSAVWYTGTWNFTAFSKYNVGLVWYYYNLWSFNWFIALAGLSFFLTIIINIVFGMITRMLMSIALFLVYPPLVGISPIDNKGAQGKWRQEFVGNILMAYGAIVGMNLCFMVLPIMQNLTFFKSTIVNLIFNMIIVLAAMITVKEIIKIFSAMIGAKDANAEGEATKNEAKKAAFAAADKAVKAVKLAATVVAAVYTGGAAVAAKEAIKAAAKKKIKKEIKKKVQEKLKKKLKEKTVGEKKEAAQRAKERAKERKEEIEEAKQDMEEQQQEQEQQANASDQSNVAKQDNNQNETTSQQNEEDANEDQDEELLDKASLLREKLDTYLDKENKITKDEFGDEKDTADEAKAWYHKERQKRMADGKFNEEELKDEAVNRFIDKSHYVDNKAEGMVDKTYNMRKAQKEKKKAERREKIKNFGGKIKNSKVVKAVGKGAEALNIKGIAASSLKAVGEISGLSGLGADIMKNTEIAQTFKGTISDFGQKLGIAAFGNIETDDKKKKAEAEEAKTEAVNRSVIKDYSEAVLRQFREIAKFMNESE